MDEEEGEGELEEEEREGGEVGFRAPPEYRGTVFL